MKKEQKKGSVLPGPAIAANNLYRLKKSRTSCRVLPAPGNRRNHPLRFGRIAGWMPLLLLLQWVIQPLAARPEEPAFSVPFYAEKLVADDDGTGVFATGDTVTYTIRIAPSGLYILSGTFNFNDTLPDGLAYVAGTARWTNPAGIATSIADNASGTPFPFDGSGSLVGNSAPLFPGDTIAVSFRAVITATSNQVITNRAKVRQGTQYLLPEVSMEVFPVVSLGNHVWQDTDKDGLRDWWEPGIDSVALNLYAVRDTNAVPDGLPDTLLLARDTTLNGGYYLFEELIPGDYFVSVDTANFSAGAVLWRHQSSYATETSPNNNIDLRDNGLNFWDPVYGISSDVITLSVGDEPTGEVYSPMDGIGNVPDESSNLTLDFGFYLPPPFDLALTTEVAHDLATGPFFPGDSVFFRITVFNQGPTPAYGFRLADYHSRRLLVVTPGWLPVIEPTPSSIRTVYASFSTILQPGEDTSVVVAFLIGPSISWSDTTLVNIVEIRSADDDPFPSNGPATDLDSYYDNLPFNDAGGLPNSPSDNAIHGDGTGMPGSDDPDTDEDDADPASFEVRLPYDLQLEKFVEESGAEGDTILFIIRVQNMTATPATDILVEDRFPDSLLYHGYVDYFDAVQEQGPGLFRIDTLPPYGEVFWGVRASVQEGFQGTSLTNVAEIVADSGFDMDSTPDNNIAEEDDQDEVTIEVPQTFDIALQKELSPQPAGPYMPGSAVSFILTLHNEGSLHAYNLRVRDRFPAGLSYAGSDTGGTDVVALGSGFFEIPFLGAGQSVSFRVHATIAGNFQGFSLTNEAEVIFDNGDDLDSTPNNDVPDEDDQGTVSFPVKQTFDLALTKQLAPGQEGPFQPGSNVQFVLTVFNQGTLTALGVEVTDFLPAALLYVGSNANGTTVVDNGDGSFWINAIAPGGSRSITLTAQIDPAYQGFSLENTAEITLDNGNDEDSAPGNGTNDEDDFAALSIDLIQTFDLALTKNLSPGNAGPFAPGTQASFRLTVWNQGSLDATNVQVADHIPAGMTYLGSNADGAVVIDEGNGAFTLTHIPAGGSVAFDVILQLDSGFQGDELTNTAEIMAAPLTDEDSTPGNGLLAEDDMAELTFAVEQVYDLSLTKSLAPGQVVPVAPGELVVFHLTLTNEGTLGATSIVVEDLLPDALAFLASDADGVAVIDNGDGTFMVPDLPAGASRTITVTTQLSGGYLLTTVINRAEITADDGEDKDSTPGNEAAGEDDLAQVVVAVDQPFDLALRKEIGEGQPAEFYPGSTVAFVLTLINQGIVDAANTEITDHLPDGLTYLSSDADGLAVVELGNGVFEVPFLAAGDSLSFTLVTAVEEGFQGLTLDNIAEITAAQETDEDSTPDNELFGEDDMDQVRLVIEQTFDLALTKTLGASTAGPYYPGNEVHFVIDLINEGTLNAYDIVIADHLPAGLIYSGSDADGVTLIDNGDGSFLLTELLYGESFSLTVYAVIDPGFSGDALLNSAEIMFAGETDTDSSPANGEMSEDDMDEVMLPVTQIFDLALTKQLSSQNPPLFSAGDTILFEITVYNQGMRDAYQVEITDYLPAGLEAIDPAWTVNGNLATRTIAGPIPAQGGMQTIILRTRVDPDYDQSTLINVAEISAADDDQDATNTPPQDIDGVYDQVAGNDAGGLAESPSDDATGGDGSGTPGSGLAATDEDDSDPCYVALCGGNPGTDGALEACRGCSQTWIVFDLFGALGGNPDADGDWTDADGAGIDLSDPGQVDFTGVLPGSYTFIYTVNDPLVCSNASAEVEVTITAMGNLVCNNLVSVSLGPDCETVVIPDMVLEGNSPCYDELIEVHLIDEQGNDIGNVITAAQVGQVLIAQMLDPECNNYCLGNIAVYDYLPPTISCPPDLGDFICTDADTLFNNPASLAFTGQPDVLDNCTEDPNISFVDQLLEGPDCGPDQLSRTFTVSDASGNTSQCTQFLTIRKAALTDVVLPPVSVEVDCADNFATTDAGFPHPSVTGFPMVETVFGSYPLDQNYCNFGAVYTDGNSIDYCAGSYTFVRSWTILDWCDPGGVTTLQQVIQVVDETGPQVTCPVVDYDGDGQYDPFVFSTGPFDCTAAFAVPLPTVSDDCSTWSVDVQIITDTLVDVTNQFGQVIGQETQTIVLATFPAGSPLFAAGIRLGCHRFRYTVTDDCDNSTVLECGFCVEDQVEPVAICDDDLTVAIGGLNSARVHASDIDEGAWDNCGVDRTEVRRLITRDPETCDPVTPYYTDWADFVEFSCCDLGDTIAVEFRVVDVYGNANGCVAGVYVTDNILPFCTPPPATDIDCDAVPVGFDPTNPVFLAGLFGEPSVSDNCAGATWEELPPVVDLDDCGYGTILRRFRGIDATGNVSVNNCQQLVTVNEVHDYTLKFPRDATATCGAAEPDTLAFAELACDLLAVSVTDLPFTPAGDECYLMLRTYRVINWCEYDGISNPVIVPRDVDCDSNPGDEDVWVLVRPNGLTYYDRDGNENNSLPAGGTRGVACGPNNPAGYWLDSQLDPAIASNGYWEYTQHIRVYDDVAPQVSLTLPDAFCSYNDTDCTAPVSIAFSLFENCLPTAGASLPADVSLQVILDLYADGAGLETVTGQVLSGAYPDYNLFGTYPLGIHEFRLQVSDGCGNQTETIVPFEVVDCKAPTPVCVNGLSVNLVTLPAGVDADGDGDEDYAAVTLPVSSFIGSPVNDCNGPVFYSINFSGETPDPARDSITLTCDNGNLALVEIYAWDLADNPYAIQPDGSTGGPNYAYCETYVLLTNVAEACQPPGQGMIMGVVTTEVYDPVSGVMVNLSGTTDAQMETEGDGTYFFDNLEEGYDFTVAPELDENHKNGVTTLDIIGIEQHILGIQPLGSPYKMIAADVNRSNSITVSDIIKIRQVVLGQDTVFDNNTSWRFVAEAFVFPDPTNPWATFFPEVISVNDLAGDYTDGDFIAVKTGDVNLSASTANFLDVEERNLPGRVNLELEDQAFAAGGKVTATFRLPADAGLLGCQFTLRFNPEVLAWAQLEPGLAESRHFGLKRVEEGILTVSWDQRGALLDLASGQPAFRLIFQARKDGRLRDYLWMADAPTIGEAYPVHGSIWEVGLLVKEDERPPVHPVLYPNYPNPFRDDTAVPFFLPEAGPVTLKIYDDQGRLWWRRHIEGLAGYQELPVTGEALPPHGLLFYVLETPGGRLTRQMTRSR